MTMRTTRLKFRRPFGAVSSTGQRTIALWRPHGYGPLKVMREELTAAIAAVVREGDEFIILPVYYAGGTTKAEVTSEMIVEDLQRVGVAARYLSDYDDALEHILATCTQGHAVLCMGARDPELPLFARKIVSALEG